MLSKAKIKWLNSLSLKKNRDDERVFVAEGVKLVSELLPVMKCKYLAYTDEKMHLVTSAKNAIEKDLISEKELHKISSFKTPQGIVAVFEKPDFQIDFSTIQNRLVIALDNVQDPGNLGTIIRLADWFGVKEVFCSLHCADIYNPKTIQATMGAIARVRVHYVNLIDFFNEINTSHHSHRGSEKWSEVNIYGTFMDGVNIYQSDLEQNGIIVMGNEGKGISKEILPFITKRLLIPSFPLDANTSESLNVSIAAAITVSEFRRRAK